MLCKKCGKINEVGEYCERCGAKLEAQEQIEKRSTSGRSISQTSKEKERPVDRFVTEYLDKAKHLSKNYFSYFYKILKNPVAEAQRVGQEQLVNALITIILYAILIPLIVYLSLSRLYPLLMQPFVNVFLKPTLGYILFILLVTGFTFLVVQLGRAKVNFRDVVARFGALLVPFVTLLLIGVILSVLNIGIFAIVLLLGFVGGIMAVPPLVIGSFKRNIKGGLDTLYGTLLTYVFTGVILAIMSNILLESLFTSLDRILYYLFF